jgi:membrane dipeptidase
MDIKRRNLLKALPLSILFPGQLLHSFTARSSPIGAINDESVFKELSSDIQQNKLDKMYDNAIIIDGLVIARGWDEDSFKALKKSGYTGFNTSLASGNLKAALKSLKDWQQIITDNPDK